MANSRLYKRLSSRARKPVQKLQAQYLGRRGYQVKANLARQEMQQAEKDQYRQRLNARRFGLARPVGPGYKG
jgi:hypothetical protein